MKQCVGCKETKPLREFYDNQVALDGKNRYCKHCCKVNRALESLRKRDRKSKISVRQNNRAKVLGIKRERVRLVNVFKIHLGLCALCGEWVQPRHASMDHIVPLSHGGTHTYDNIQLTHLICNLKKSNNVL